MFEKIPVESSNLDAVAYDAENKRTLVWFKNGGLYAYNNVPQETYEQFLAAESKGEFLNAELKPKFPATKVLHPEHNPLLSGFTQQVLTYLDWHYAYHPPNETQAKVYDAIRQKAKEFAAVILANCPADESRQRALDMVKTAMMTANQAVALNPAHYDPELRKKLLAAQAEMIAKAKADQEAQAAAAAKPGESIFAGNGVVEAPKDSKADEAEHAEKRAQKKAKKH